MMLCVLLLFPFWTAFAGGKSENLQSEKSEYFPVTDPLPVPQGQDERLMAESRPSESRAEAVFRAIAKAYPDRAREPEFLDGDWSIEVYGERFYFAEGRLLPDSLRDQIGRAHV